LGLILRLLTGAENTPGTAATGFRRAWRGRMPDDGLIVVSIDDQTAVFSLQIDPLR
jgi:hypothetical protein